MKTFIHLFLTVQIKYRIALVEVKLGKDILCNLDTRSSYLTGLVCSLIFKHDHKIVDNSEN